jgi:hypothetical protein
VTSVIDQIVNLGATALWDKKSGILLVNSEFRVSIVLCRHTETATGCSRWLIRLDESQNPDLTVAIRMDALNSGVFDYYLLPSIDMEASVLRTAEQNGITLDAYRFETLNDFFELTKRVPIPEAA